jgi:hypothetical protein
MCPPETESILFGDLEVSVTIAYVVVGICNDLRSDITELVLSSYEDWGDAYFLPNCPLAAEGSVRATADEIA